MDAAKIRAWWSHCQGLDGRLADATPAKVLEHTGWARSVGGTGPYLGLYARCGAGRDAVDQAVANLEIHELPSARGCTYVLPKSAFALGLKLGQGAPEADMKVARKLGVTDAEVAKLCKTVIQALKKGPLDPEELRTATGGASRSLGEDGKKKGLTTTLPLALGQLQADGEIRRVSTNGRLDQQRYRYTLWRPNPLATFKLSADEAYTQLARFYFDWIGPATAAEFQAFAGLGVKAAKAAMDPIKLRPLEAGDEHLMPPGRLEEFQAFKTPKDPHYTLVSSLDGILLLRRNVKSLLAADDLKKAAFDEKARKVEMGGLMDLPSHAILDRGRLVGLWEYDPESQSIVWTSFVGSNSDLEKAVRQTEEFVRVDLGDARSFSLDSPKSRAPRIQALRESGH
ncbi:MAG: DNA glycosylase AlkZ-like family protein [Terriglobia bacterium]